MKTNKMLKLMKLIGEIVMIIVNVIIKFRVLFFALLMLFVLFLLFFTTVLHKYIILVVCGSMSFYI